MISESFLKGALRSMEILFPSNSNTSRLFWKFSKAALLRTSIPQKRILLHDNKIKHVDVLSEEKMYAYIEGQLMHRIEIATLREAVLLS